MRKTRLVVDTSFLLPILGIEVEEVSEEVIRRLGELAGKVKLLYPVPLLVELVGKAAKKAAEQGLRGLPQEAVKGLELILSGAFIEVTVPSASALSLAARMWAEGHRDLLDDIAYACSLDLNAYFLTIDYKLVEFLKRHNYPTDNVIGVEELKALSSSKP